MEFASRIQPCIGSTFVLPAEVSATVGASIDQSGTRYHTSNKVVFQLESYGKGGSVTCHDVDVELRKTTEVNANTLRDAVRDQVSALSNEYYEYDMRAICFAVGHMISCMWAGVPIPTEQSDVVFLAGSVTAVRNDDILFCMPPNCGREVGMVLSIAAKICGVGRIYMASSQGLIANPPSQASHWRFALHCTVQFLLTDAAALGCYGEHAVAFSRGLTSHVTVRAHSDEGGWWRGALRRADYPRPRGYLNAVLQSFSLPHFGKAKTNEYEFTKDVTAMLLTLVACIQDADPLAGDTQSTILLNSVVEQFLEPDDRVAALGGDGAARPSAFPQLRVVASQFESHAVKVFNLSDVSADRDFHLSSLPRDTFRSFFAADSVDEHLRLEVLMPYLYVENSVVLRHPSTVRQTGPKAGRISAVPYFNFPTTVSTRDVGGVDRTGVQLSRVVYARVGGACLREMGIFYTSSDLWNGGAHEGMQNMGILQGHAGTGEVSMARSRENPTMSNIRWTRPHCPIPAPGECTFDKEGLLVRIERWRNGRVFLEGGITSQQVVNLSVSALEYRNVVSLNTHRYATYRNMSRDFRVRMTDAELDAEQEMENEAIALLFNLERDPRYGVTRGIVDISAPPLNGASQVLSDTVDRPGLARFVDNETRANRTGGALPAAVAASSGGAAMSGDLAAPAPDNIQGGAVES